MEVKKWDKPMCLLNFLKQPDKRIKLGLNLFEVKYVDIFTLVSANFYLCKIWVQFLLSNSQMTDRKASHTFPMRWGKNVRSWFAGTFPWRSLPFVALPLAKFSHTHLFLPCSHRSCRLVAQVRRSGWWVWRGGKVCICNCASCRANLRACIAKTFLHSWKNT